MPLVHLCHFFPVGDDATLLFGECPMEDAVHERGEYAGWDGSPTVVFGWVAGGGDYVGAKVPYDSASDKGYDKEGMEGYLNDEDVVGFA